MRRFFSGEPGQPFKKTPKILIMGIFPTDRPTRILYCEAHGHRTPPRVSDEPFSAPTLNKMRCSSHQMSNMNGKKQHGRQTQNKQIRESNLRQTDNPGKWKF